jgi:hypothetical protein
MSFSPGITKTGIQKFSRSCTCKLSVVQVLYIKKMNTSTQVKEVNVHARYVFHVTTKALDEPVKWRIEPKRLFAAPKCFIL